MALSHSINTRKATMSYWIIYIFLGACQHQEKEQEQPADLTCIEMTRSQCMQSASCTLELTEENSIYNCREAAGVCEEGVVQNDIMGFESDFIRLLIGYKSDLKVV